MTAPAKHTPGPWRNCQPSSNFEKGYAIIRPLDGDKGIASITKNYKFGENDANAKLIAAAPDMAEALRFYANAWKVLTNELRSGPPYRAYEEIVDIKTQLLPADELMEDCGNKARAALMKAGIA
jgi:hypothetical protein